MRVACVWFLFVQAPLLWCQGSRLPETNSDTQTMRVIRGRVVDSSRGSTRTVANATVTLYQTGKSVTTDSAGLFVMPLPVELVAGDSVQFDITLPGYAVYQPVEGVIRIPR